MKFVLAATLALIASPALADHARPNCETAESKRLFAVSAAMYKAAGEIRGPLANGGTMSSQVYDAMEAQGATARGNFEAQGKQYLIQARAEMAKKCPDIAQAIMTNLPANADELAVVRVRYDAAMAKEWAELDRIFVWRKAHPQCHYVEWFGGGSWATSGGRSGTTLGSKEDLRGIHGRCTVDGDGPIYFGDRQTSETFNPDKNKAIGQVACAEALTAEGFESGVYATPEHCQRLRTQ